MQERLLQTAIVMVSALGAFYFIPCWLGRMVAPFFKKEEQEKLDRLATWWLGVLMEIGFVLVVYWIHWVIYGN